MSRRFNTPRSVFAVDLELNPFTRSIEDVGGVYDKRYEGDNVYGNLWRLKIFTSDISELTERPMTIFYNVTAQCNCSEPDCGVAAAIVFGILFISYAVGFIDR